MTRYHGSAGLVPACMVERPGACGDPPRRTTTIVSRPAARESTALVLRSAGADDRFEVVVAGRAGEALRLGPFDEENVVAIWRGLASATGRPLAFEDADGHVVAPFPQVGRLMLGPVRIRRRIAVLSGRRPRFLARRKSARLPRRPLVYREPELARRNDGR